LDNGEDDDGDDDDYGKHVLDVADNEDRSTRKFKTTAASKRTQKNGEGDHDDGDDDEGDFTSKCKLFR
jgi:hypothetical protein